MKLRIKLLTLVASVTFIATAAAAQAPVATVDPQAHGNLASAQQSIIEAFNFISASQRANDDQLGGHAGRAKELLRQANDEISAAAAVADSHQDGALAAPPPTGGAPTPTAPPSGPPNLSGNWTIYAYNTNQPGSSLKQIEVVQTGNIISGTFHGPHQHGKFQGWVSGNHVEFSTDTNDVLTFRGQITATGMSGMYGFHGQTAPWTAERTN
jgi:hypothetical protein